MNFHDTAAAVAVRDDSMRAVERSRSEPQAHTHAQQPRIRSDDVRGGQRGSRDERLPHQRRGAQEGRLYNQVTYMPSTLRQLSQALNVARGNLPVRFSLTILSTGREINSGLIE